MLYDERVKARLEDLEREIAHDRLMNALPPRPRRSPVARMRGALVRCRAVVAELGTTRPVLRRVGAWITPR
jgi:hypothetical protein